MEDMLINMGVTVILQMLKDNKAAKKWKRAMLKIFAAIAATYRTEEEFHAAAEKGLNA